MSGGYYDYKYFTLEDTYSGEMEDKELNKLVEDLSELLHDLEWWKSGDYVEDDYRDTLKRFKDKWIKDNVKLDTPVK
ncbi:hypothetical protein [Priestia megaterium]|uniref:hypothetical protein n=1 Tax=Priestia megaterium TaxID=1404 RepID=UPI001127729F|nr:hypothetical protein [Priestia megaterium]TPF18009.1 hypothetical protein CBE78_01935 [Priestia megaterium]TPF22116.1 hypothetical protein CBE79_04440 [Priestia megaterium]